VSGLTAILKTDARRLAVVACAGFLAVCFLPAAAQASCGDYLHVGTPANTQRGHPTNETSVPNQPIPCFGPNCSHMPEDNGPLIPPLTPTAENDWAVALGTQVFIDPINGTRLLDDSSPRPICRGTPPDPPPKLPFATI
jgi:hypothetical protein